MEPRVEPPIAPAQVGLVQRVTMLSRVMKEKEQDLENSLDTFQSLQMETIADEVRRAGSTTKADF